MTIKKFIKDNFANCLLCGLPIDFNTIYQEYNAFKKIGNELTKEYGINKIEIKDSGIIIPKSFINKDISNDPIITDFTHNNIKEHIHFSILSNAISTILKKQLYNKKYHDKIKELDDTFIKSNGNDYKKLVEFLPNEIEKYGLNNNLYNISEKLRPYDKTTRLENYLDFDDNYSLYFHLLIIEIVYYTNELYYNSKPPKLCSVCHEPHYQNSKLCAKCIAKRNNERRKANAKCKTLRNKLDFYIHKYWDQIPTEIRMKTERMLEDETENKYTDLKKLERLKNAIEKELNN